MHWYFGKKFRIKKLIIKTHNNFKLKQIFVFLSYSDSDQYEKMYGFQILQQRTTIDKL
jgi:hypothetical protein